jgi:hypothetical protein
VVKRISAVSLLQKSMEAISQRTTSLANEVSSARTVSYELDDKIYRLLVDYNTIRFHPETTERYDGIGRRIMNICNQASIKGLPPRPRVY